MKKALLISAFGALFGATAVVAGPGSIPIYQPTTIVDPGHYVLTRDFEVADVIAIEIQSDHVELDLNGHTITSTSADYPVISVDNASFVQIKNGRLIGGQNGIAQNSTTGSILRIERVALSGAFGDDLMYLPDILVAEVLSCTFKGTNANAIYIAEPPGGSGAVSGRVVDNSIDVPWQAISVSRATGFVIKGNVVTGADKCLVIGSFLAPRGGNIIEGNSCDGLDNPLYPTLGIQLENDNNLVLGNSVKGFSDGILVHGNGNRIAGNVVAGSVIVGTGNGSGIWVSERARNLIEDNQIEGNAGCGILLHATSADNAYRNNMLRGNGGGAVCDSGTGNTSEGGNIY